MLDFKNKKGIKEGLIFIFFLFAGINVFAQQDPMFTQYMYNPVTINPAYAGSNGTLNLTALHRQQWVGIDGAPKTLALSLNSPFIKYNVGIGFSLLYDQIGPVKQTGLYADYAYHLKVTNDVKLAFGLKGGVNVYDINLINLIGAASDEQVQLSGVRKMYLPNFGVGTYLYSDWFYVGLSVPKLLQNSLSDDTNNLDALNKEERHYFFTGGFIVTLAENIRLKPTTTLRVVNGAPNSVELSANLLFHDRLWVGGMYRFQDALGAMVKFNITNQLSLGYAYDITQSRLKSYNQGTHEVYVSYDFAFQNKKILSPRFF